MEFTVLSSSSRANGYLLHNNREALVIEAGVSLLKVKKTLDFRLGMITGCIVSHRHKDHYMQQTKFIYHRNALLESNYRFLAPNSKSSSTGSILCRIHFIHFCYPFVGPVHSTQFARLYD